MPSPKQLTRTLAAAMAVIALAYSGGAKPVAAGGSEDRDEHAHPSSARRVIVVNTPANPVPVVQQGTSHFSGDVTVTNLPAVQDVRVTNTSLPVTIERTLEHDGTYFSITMTGTTTPPPRPLWPFLPESC
jgi:hypothetical protein